MYAVIQTGGKQYRVSPGDVLEVERLEGQVGEQVAFEDVLILADEGDLELGTPSLSGARVVGTIVEQGKGDKVIVFKFKRRKMVRRKAGHRQLFTGVKIESIESPSGKTARVEAERPVARKKAAEPETVAAETKKAAPQKALKKAGASAEKKPQKKIEKKKPALKSAAGPKKTTSKGRVAGSVPGVKKKSAAAEPETREKEK